MQLNDHSLILKIDPFREHDALVTVFGREHGLLRGVAKYALSSKQRGTYQVGNWVEIEWSARLEEHLGNITAELSFASGAMIGAHRQRCYALQSACALLLMAFEQRDAHPRLYNTLESFVESLRFGKNWAADYARFEAVLLQESGFGLGLESCIVTGQMHDLRYVSPKSGCAICAQEGRQYHDKLFAYPELLMKSMNSEASAEYVSQALEITGHFLHKWLFSSLDKPLPQSRGRLLESLNKLCAQPA